MIKSIVIELEDREAIADPVTDLLRAGAQQLIERAVEAELSELLYQSTAISPRVRSTTESNRYLRQHNERQNPP